MPTATTLYRIDQRQQGKTVVATTGGSIVKHFSIITPGSLRHIATYDGQAMFNSSKETKTGLAPQHPLTCGSEALAFGQAVASACAKLAQSYPGVAPPELSELLSARRHYCNGMLEVRIEVYEYVQMGEGEADWINQILGNFE